MRSHRRKDGHQWHVAQKEGLQWRLLFGSTRMMPILMPMMRDDDEDDDDVVDDGVAGDDLDVTT
jgi:hypothetical protein